MFKNTRRILSISASIPIFLSACVSRPPLAVAECPREAPRTLEMQAPAPAPQLFQQCMGEILATGQGKQESISVPCSTLLHFDAMK